MDRLKNHYGMDSTVKEYLVGILENFTIEESYRKIDSSDVRDALEIFLLDCKMGESEINLLCNDIALELSENYQEFEFVPLEASMKMQGFEENANLSRAKVDLQFGLTKNTLSHINSKEIEKAEMKLKLKQARRERKSAIKTTSEVSAQNESVLQEADIHGGNKDIRLENFDIALGGKPILTGCDLVIAKGRRYGLVGRNGVGKSTLLRSISSRQLDIPRNISILHVEQEVIGDDTTALESVLNSNDRLRKLIEDERDCNLILESESSTEMDKDSASDKLVSIYKQLEGMAAETAEARASEILFGLGFTSETYCNATKTFSGGWRMRIALARALFCAPDLLLLDEPTNMLDIPAVIWLEKYLQTWEKSILVVSHDRRFLDVISTDILHLHHEMLDAYRGNYTQFVVTKEEKIKNYQREYEAQMEYRAHLQAFIDKWRYNAKRAPQAQMKIKILEKLPVLRPVATEPTIHFQFPPVENLNTPIVQMDDVSFGYSPDKMLLSNVSFSMDLGSRIAIVGPNGSGKTTFLNLMTKKLQPTSGYCHLNGKLRFAFFSQHFVDQLDMSMNSIEFLQSKYPGLKEEEYRRHLGSFGVSGPLGMQSIQTLSGGQKSRVVFATLNMMNPHILVLDEPTNHLDMDSIDALTKAIKKFEGGVIVVSHDERFIHAACREIVVCKDGTISKFNGEISDYVKSLHAE